MFVLDLLACNSITMEHATFISNLENKNYPFWNIYPEDKLWTYKADHDDILQINDKRKERFAQQDSLWRYECMTILQKGTGKSFPA